MISNSVFVMILTVILFCLTTSTPLPTAKTANKKPNSLSLKLLHRSSIPLFENENFQDFLENNKQLFLKDSNFFTTAPLFQATTEYLYFVNLSIGDPPVPQYLAVDTGSSMVWVISKSTNKKFLYQGRYSSTYTSVSCRSPECSLSRNFRCSLKKGSDLCLYQQLYANGISMTSGFLGLDRFVFPNNKCDFCDDYLDKVLFGVAIVSTGPLFGGPNFNGMLGLGPKNTSLLRNFPQKFSYCIGDIFNSSSQSSFLELGDVGDWNYHDERVVFDTGSVYTFLADQAYDALADYVDEFMKSRGYYVDPQNKDTQMCYDGQMKEISDFPLLKFHFVDKNVTADLSLRIEYRSLFYDLDPLTFCITMIKSSSKDMLLQDFTIIGLMAQQNHTILFDLENSRMSIEHTSCES
ncbi:hypothetical protein POM88_020284 [Heracleum sosnowskyi]|uniref:Peptidase A1 domain-containing protein n=1 Tax=Heracleum sosnowskyi TaxID=360622 RepID=A0AAD8MRT7_9APIA|nr:hypothetical protein POM88_020284 [Heracleum sosnowskyi]